MTRREILEAAAAIVTQDREEQYGKAEDNFGLIAELWEPYIRETCVEAGAGVNILPEDVGILIVPAKNRQNRHGAAKSRQFCGLGGICRMRGGDCNGRWEP